MADQTHELTPAQEKFQTDVAWLQARINPSALPIGPASLNLLLAATIRTIEEDELGQERRDEAWQARLVVCSIYRRLSPTERFRLHSSLHASIGYVPTWVQEITS